MLNDSLPSRDGNGAVARKSQRLFLSGDAACGPRRRFSLPSIARVAAVSLIALATGCDNAPGKPEPAPLVPEEIGDFKDLYAQNCQGCHGEKGGWGPAPHISDPLYLKLTTPQIIRKVIAEGRHGTPMPVFSAALGGALSDQQINTLVDGIEKAWATPIDLHGTALPPYSEADSIAAGLQPGDPDRGHNTYLMYCARCHGVGNGKSLVGAIANPSYLALVSNQSLRTTAIIGTVRSRHARLAQPHPQPHHEQSGNLRRRGVAGIATAGLLQRPDSYRLFAGARYRDGCPGA